MPGYWMPPTMKNNVTPSAVQSPPLLHFVDCNKIFMDSEIIPIQQNSKMSNSLSTISLQSMSTNDPIVPNRSIPAPATSPSPSGFKTKKHDISGPMNFKHISGDMTRDRTRNAFNLTANSNDNVLKKYMIERGIREQDISGMHKQDLIKKIVHSNFTWMPTKRIKETQLPSLAYATVSSTNQKTLHALEAKEAKPLFANYTSLTSKFIDIGDNPASEYLLETGQPPTVNNTKRFKQRLPALQRLSKPTVAPPPPPSILTSFSKTPIGQKKQTVNTNKYGTIISKNSIVEAYNKKEPFLNVTEPCEESKSLEICERSPKDFLQSKPSEILSSSPALNSAPAPIPPPPPPPLLSSTPSVNKTYTASLEKGKIYGDDSNWESHLENIRTGITLKKVAQKSATVSGVQFQIEKRPPAVDFLSELKLGINLRHAKNSSANIDNVNTYLDESHA